ncbi:hypothetical protein GTP44_26875 [Duganella sp. FT50W]|uniref:Uncharacterized protein n=1 Tax=Duganella lactea TaxID=2692173 RepID=A0A6L8MTZ1_9BURK|nr:hypothetical protein [Duganella lactea]
MFFSFAHPTAPVNPVLKNGRNGLLIGKYGSPEKSRPINNGKFGSEEMTAFHAFSELENDSARPRGAPWGFRQFGQGIPIAHQVKFFTPY